MIRYTHTKNTEILIIRIIYPCTTNMMFVSTIIPTRLFCHMLQSEAWGQTQVYASPDREG